MKRCMDCGEMKPTEDFPTWRDSSGSRVVVKNRCRRCFTAYYSRREQRRTAQSKSQHVASIREWQGQNREKRRAHHAVERALASGKLVRPDACEDCAKTGYALEAHHEDYSLPLVVLWLCRSCHRKRHV